MGTVQVMAGMSLSRWEGWGQSQGLGSRPGLLPLSSGLSLMHCSISLPSVLTQGSEQVTEAPGTSATGALDNANKKETHGRRTHSCALGSKGAVTARHIPLRGRAWVQAGG